MVLALYGTDVTVVKYLLSLTVLLMGHCDHIRFDIFIPTSLSYIESQLVQYIHKHH